MGGTPRPFLPDNTVSVAWSPDGTRVVYHLQDKGDSMFVADHSGENARLIFRRKANEHNHFPIWSVDGRWIYFTSGTPETKEMDIWRVSAEGGTPERLTKHNSDVAYPTPISPVRCSMSRTTRMARVHGYGRWTSNASSRGA